MILNIELKKNRNMYCDESAAATVATWLKRNYEMMFANMIGFEFDIHSAIRENIIGPNINPGFDEYDFFLLLEKYHGIKAFCPSTNHYDIVEVVMGELRKRNPVLVFLRERYCSWKDANGDKCTWFLIIGYDDHNFFGYDIHSNSSEIVYTEIENVKLNYIFNNDLGYTIFRIVSEEAKVGREDIRKYICKKEYLSHNPFDQMRDLASCIEKGINLENEKFDYTELNDIPILNNIMNILRARKLVATSCDMVYRKSGDEFLHKIGLDFLKLGGEWNVIWGLLLKLFCFENNVKNKCCIIADKIRNVSYMEEKLIRSLLLGTDSEEKNNVSVVDGFDISNSFVTMEEICLDKYYNNKAFEEEEKNIQCADFTGHGEYFLKGQLPKNRIISVYSINFHINCGNDNILCEGQIVKEISGIHRQLCILGCSEWGEGGGTMEVIYEDGCISEYYIVFWDWFFCYTKDVYVAWRGKAKISSNEIADRGLFCISINLDYDRRIKYIKLPICENMHIFGIVLLN